MDRYTILRALGTLVAPDPDKDNYSAITIATLAFVAGVVALLAVFA